MVQVVVLGAPPLALAIVASAFVIGVAISVYGPSRGVPRLAGLAMALGALVFIVSSVGYDSTACSTGWYPGCGDAWNRLFQLSAGIAALGTTVAIVATVRGLLARAPADQR